MRHRVTTTVRLLTPAAALATLLSRVGTAPFERALDRVTLPTVAAGVVLTFLTTQCSAARWRWTADALGVHVDRRRAVAAYYRSQLLNQTLPGGVLGDLDRAMSPSDGDPLLSARAVAWERGIGQLVLISVTTLGLLVLPSVLRDPAGVVVGLVGAGAAVALVVVRAIGARARPRGRVATALRSDVRRMWTRGDLSRPALLSLGATAGYVSLLWVSLWSSGVPISPARSLPLLLAVLLASSLPTNVAGWGPREGVAAWVFSLAGLGAGTGVTVAATYGILSLLGCAPGAVLVVRDLVRSRTERRVPWVPNSVPTSSSAVVSASTGTSTTRPTDD